MQVQYDEYGIPVNVDDLQRALFSETDSRLEKILGRKLTTTEKSAAESMASEHASYGSTRYYLKTILPVNGPNHFAGVGSEAASVVFLADDHGSVALSYSSETHNGPSYVCAHPGAATGTGGNERDNAAQDAKKPEAVFEARRQGHPDHNTKGDPIRQHTEETTRGIGDYANAMGIPHGDGSIKYHPGFTGNNLVNVMAISVAPKQRLMRNKVPEGNPSDYLVIYVGKAADKTGLYGTKFASQPIDMTQNDLNEKAVQDPDPHLQEADVRGIVTVVDTALTEGWKEYISIKDMGAAGLLCVTLEQLRDNIGMVINGDLVPQNYPLSSTELLEGETQERFGIIVHRDYAQKVVDIFNDGIGLPNINKGACAKIIGRCNDTGRYVFVRNGVVDVDVPVEDLAAGPLLYRSIKEPNVRKQKMPHHVELKSAIDGVLESINFKSDEYIHSHYDKHVRSTNIVNRGEGSAILRTHPLLKNIVAYSVSFDSNSVIGYLSPSLQAEDSFVRAAYRLALVGCSIVGVTNNANFGRTDVPEEMWGFKEAQEGIARACYNWQLEQEYVDMILRDPEIAEKFARDSRRHVTVNSGNCSMNKANATTGTAIPPTTILGVIGWTNQPYSYVKWDMAPLESALYLIGARQTALGATDYLQACFGPDCLGDVPYSLDYETSQREVDAIIRVVRDGLVASGNVIEEGGLCNATAEMVANSKSKISAHVGVYRDMSQVRLDSYQKLFSENPGVVLQVLPNYEHDFKALCGSMGVSTYQIGQVEPSHGLMRFVHTGEEIKYSQEALRGNYVNKLARKLGALK